MCIILGEGSIFMNKIKKYLIYSFVILFGLLLGPQVIEASIQRTWSFGDSSNFDVEGSENLLFSDGSVKVVPNGMLANQNYAWYDTHFSNETAYTVAWGGDIDDSGNYYIAGSTASASDASRYAFIVKLDSSFNEVWYKQFFEVKSTTSSENGFDGIRLDSDGNIIATAFYYDDLVLKNAYIKIAKINPDNGEIIWQIDRAKGNNWIDTWDDGGDGPIFDSSGNIYVVHAIGDNNNGGAGPIEVLKIDTNGNIIWNVEEDVLEGRVAANEYPHYEDLWQIVVDSEDSLYISATVTSGLGDANGGLNYGLTKINSDGVTQWRKIKDMFDRWDAPRGMSIDSEDNIYQNGNADSGCGIRKVLKDGTVLVDNSIEAYITNFIYAWHSSISIFDQYFLTVSRGTEDDISTVVLDQDLSELYHASFEIDDADGTTWGYNTATRFNKYGDPVHFITYVGNSEHGNTRTPAIIKASYTYPDQDTNNKIRIRNKTGVAYDDLQSFRTYYGGMNQGSNIGYQISNNGSNWYYFDGTSWVIASEDQYNSESEVNENISRFSDQLGPGEFYFRVYIDTEGVSQINISSVQLGYNGDVTSLPVTGKSSFINKIFYFIKNLF